jgi:hypothetical protein
MDTAMASAQTGPSLSELTADEIRARAQEYRDMAVNARMVGTREALLRLAERLERLASEKEPKPG